MTGKRGCLALIFALVAPLGGIFAENEPVLELDPGGHRATVRAILWTPDERYVVTGSDDKTIRVWHAATGELVRTFRGFAGLSHEGKIFALSLSPNGHHLAVGGGWLGKNESTGRHQHAGVIRILDFRTGEPLRLLRGHRNVITALAYSPDGRVLASGAGDGSVYRWQTSPSGRYLLAHEGGHLGQVHSLGFSGDSRLLASASFDGSIALWGSEGVLHRQEAAHEDMVHAVLFSPDSRSLVSSSEDGTLKIWTVHDFVLGRDPGRLLFRLPSHYAQTMAWTKAGLLVGGLYQEKRTENGSEHLRHPIFRLDPKTGQVLGRYWAHTNVVQDIAISPSGRVASTGGNHGESFIWDISTGRTLRRLAGAGGAVFGVGFGKDVGTVLWGNENARNCNNCNVIARSLKLHNLQPAVPGAASYSRAISYVGGRSLEPTGGVYSKAIRVGSKIIVLPTADFDQIRSYTFTPNGETVIIGSDFALHSVDASTGAILGEFKGHEGPVWAVSPSPDGKRLLSGSHDQTLRLWDIATRQLTATIFVANDDEWIVALPDRYFAASPNGHKCFGWKIVRREDQSALFYSFDQFDLIYNRPDKVFRALFPDADSRSEDPFLREMGQKVERLYAHWKKRVAQHGFRPEELEAGVKISAPEVKYKTPPPDYEVVTSPDYSFTATITDPIPGQKIRGYRLSVNGVPVGQSLVEKDQTGRPIAANSITVKRTVRLSAVGDGRNIIELSGLNEKGVESRREAIRLLYRPKRAVKPRLYVASFGVNDYRGNKDFGSLTYARKDSDEIRTILKRHGSAYYSGGVRVLERGVHDREVTKAGIEALRRFWKDSTVDDTVIVYVAGHGMSRPVKRTLLGREYDDFDYYFVTSTATVERLGSEAITIDRLREIMETTPARQKMLFMDTCQSYPEDAGTEGGRGTKTERTVVKLKNGGEVTFSGARSPRGVKLLMNATLSASEAARFFPELRRGVGVVEVSAAVNGQAALEAIRLPDGTRLANGVFTYAVKQAIEKRLAEKGGAITAKGLRAYVLGEVERLTLDEHGVPLQTPMTARDLAGRDFVVIGK